MGKGHSLFFNEIARKYNGFHRGQHLFRQPSAFFHYRDSRCRIRLVKRLFSTSKYTEFAIHWLPPGTVLKIVGNGAPMTPADRNLEQIESLPGGTLPDRFQIQALPGGTAANLLTPAAQWRITQLASLPPVVPLVITLANGQLTILRAAFPASYESLDDFVRLCLELHDQFRLAVAEGVEFDDSVAASIEDTRCPVCSSEMDGPIVICARCRTPHCRDCWLYNGKCGMYACNETRFVARH